jgi:hypothetical protein
VVRVMSLGSHVSIALVLCVDGSLDDSSVQFLALYAHAHADIPLFLLALVGLVAFEFLASSHYPLIESM